MSASPVYKIYTDSNEYIGCVKYLSDAAALVSLYPAGSTVRNGHSKKYTIWTNGIDMNASASYDASAEIMTERLEKFEEDVRRSNKEYEAKVNSGFYENMRL